MAFPPEFLEELRRRVTLSSLVGRRVKLIRRGREHSGLCPFHKEKTPSFTVSDDKAFYHCFGCGEHGDAIGFVMAVEGLSFPEAVERLAGEAGLEVPQASPDDQARAAKRSGLIELLEEATCWFEAQLTTSAGREARDYLTTRGLREETIAAFRLGFAPPARGQLIAALRRQGFAEAELIEAGLVKEAEGGGPLRDHFFNRIIFPIRERRGRVIGFGGRTMGDSKAKYINSPETPLFHKGRLLYNIDKALKAARDHREVVVAEGYMDVIAMAQEGFSAVVAPLGTAVTEQQIEELWRLDREPLFCLDGDAAGRRAALRAAERVLPLLKAGFSLRFAFLPQDEDPDSLLKAQGAQALREVLGRALPLVELLWRREASAREITTPERRAALRQSLWEVVREIPDQDLRRDYHDALMERFEERFPPRHRRRAGFDPRSSAGSGWQRSSSRIGPGRASVLPLPDPENRPPRREQLLLALLINHPALLLEAVEDLAALDFGNRDLESLRAALVDLAAESGEEDTENARLLSGPHLDSEALECHLRGQGYSGIVDVLQSRKVLEHGSFARSEATEEAARDGFASILAEFRRDAARSEMQRAARDFAVELDEKNLARVQAHQKLDGTGESDNVDLEGHSAGNLAERS